MWSSPETPPLLVLSRGSQPLALRDRLDEHGSALVLLPDWALAPECDPQRLLGAEHGAYETMRTDYAKRRMLASRWLVKSSVASLLGCEAAAVHLTADVDGRPKLAACDSLDFNLSHTKRAVLLGLTRVGRIGVDVEPAERDLMKLRIAPAACTPVEEQRLAALAPERRNEYLVRLWTLKEAHAKALGSGLAAGFTGFGFDLAGDSAARVDEPGRPPADGAWQYRSWRVEQLWASAAITESCSDKETP